MRARSMIKAAEVEAKLGVWAGITAEAQRLSVQFSEAEFISKVSGGGGGGATAVRGWPNATQPRSHPTRARAVHPGPAGDGRY